MPVDGETQGAKEYHICPSCGQGRWDTKGHWASSRKSYLCRACYYLQCKVNAQSARKAVHEGKSRGIIFQQGRQPRKIQDRDRDWVEGGEWKCPLYGAHHWKLGTPKDGQIVGKCDCEAVHVFALSPVVAGSFEEHKLWRSGHD